MVDQNPDGNLEGILRCPNLKCGEILGSHSFYGQECSCGYYKNPSFKIVKDKIKESEVLEVKTDTPDITSVNYRRGRNTLDSKQYSDDMNDLGI
jgi:hypothetical protein